MYPSRLTLLALALATTFGCVDGDVDPETDTAAFAVANPDKTVVCHDGHEIAVPFRAVLPHLSHGDFLGPCAPTDAAAGAAAQGVLVCHRAGTRTREIEVPFVAVTRHLAHGDFLGPCSPPE